MHGLHAYYYMLLWFIDTKKSVKHGAIRLVHPHCKHAFDTFNAHSDGSHALARNIHYMLDLMACTRPVE